MLVVISLTLTFLIAGLKGSKFTSSTLVSHLINLQQIEPELQNCPIDCELYIQSGSALGFNGPLGSLGPLGTMGPVSSHIWSPASEFAWHGNFFIFLNQILGYFQNSTFALLAHQMNPLSDKGPLGDSFWDTMPHINDFTRHMQGLGLFSVLGPIGPLGPLGALGPLGPVGAHGLRVSENGEYLDVFGNVKREILAVYNETLMVTWPLFERYSNKKIVDYLGRAGKLDTSFMVRSITDENGEYYNMTITEPQYVTILVTPVMAAKNFIILVYVNNVKIIKTNTLFFTPWVQFYVSKQDLERHNNSIDIRVVVKSDLLDCGLIIPIVHCSMEYYFYVVGSTEFMLRRPHLNYHGTYIQEYFLTN